MAEESPSLKSGLGFARFTFQGYDTFIAFIWPVLVWWRM